jgi:hypothetical protein
LVSTKGIEANPNKIKALVKMQDPISVNDVQKLTGRVATFNRFIPRVAERSLPFFQVLRSSENFQLSEAQKQDFQELKDYLSNMTKLCPPEPKSPLLLYLSTSNLAVSAVLVQEKEEEGKLKQILVYFEGPIRRTREGGSEWEPIKILLEGDGNSNKMNTTSNTRLRLTTQVG